MRLEGAVLGMFNGWKGKKEKNLSQSKFTSFLYPFRLPGSTKSHSSLEGTSLTPSCHLLPQPRSREDNSRKDGLILLDHSLGRDI
jgi:hypothetical protein